MPVVKFGHKVKQKNSCVCEIPKWGDMKRCTCGANNKVSETECMFLKPKKSLYEIVENQVVMEIDILKYQIDELQNKLKQMENDKDKTIAQIYYRKLCSEEAKLWIEMHGKNYNKATFHWHCIDKFNREHVSAFGNDGYD